MAIKHRERISSNAGLKKAEVEAGKGKMHKISLEVDAYDFKVMKRRCIEKGVSLSGAFREFIKDFIK